MANPLCDIEKVAIMRAALVTFRQQLQSEGAADHAATVLEALNLPNASLVTFYDLLRCAEGTD